MTATIAHPAMGAWALKTLGAGKGLLPGNILINGSPQHAGRGYMPSHLAPFPIVDPEAGLQDSIPIVDVGEADFLRRTALVKTLLTRFASRTPHRVAAAYRQTQEEAIVLMRSDDLKVFDIARESEKARNAYESHTFGKGCLLAGRLVESGVRFV